MACKTKKRNLHSSITTVRDVKNSARHIHVITLHDEKRTTQKRYAEFKTREEKTFWVEENTIPVRWKKNQNGPISWLRSSHFLANSTTALNLYNTKYLYRQPRVSKKVMTCSYEISFINTSVHYYCCVWKHQSSVCHTVEVEIRIKRH